MKSFVFRERNCTRPDVLNAVEVSKKRPVSQSCAEIEEELRNQYNLCYTLDKTDSLGSYHKILLSAKQKNLVMRGTGRLLRERGLNTWSPVR